MVIVAAAAMACLWQHHVAGATLDHLRALADDLVRASATEFPNLSRAVRRVEEFPANDMVDVVRRTARRGKYDRASGTVYIATVSQTGAALPASVVAGIVAHELAHAASVGSHGDEWRAAYLKLVDIATRVLGWRVMLECSSCGMYKVCTPAQCPLCDWKSCSAKKSSPSPSPSPVKSSG